MKTRIGVLTAWLMSLLTMQAAVETWDGGHSSANDWSANLNWLDDTAPIDGDSLVFTGTARLTHYAYGNLGGSDGDFDVVGITFDDAAGAFVINNAGGGTITLQGGITNDSSNLQTLNFPFMITNGNARVDTVSDDITINGNISDDGNRVLYKIGTGTLTLSGVNSYGYTKVSTVNGPAAGMVSVESSSALGSGAFEFEAGGTLNLGANGLNLANIVRVLYRNDTSARTVRLDLSGANTGEVSGNVDLRWNAAYGFVVDVGEDDTLTVSGTIENQNGGGCGVTKTGAGTLVITGANTYSTTGHGTTISNGTLLVNNVSGSGTGTKPVNVKNGATLGGTGSMSGLVTVDSGGHIAPGTSIGTLTMTGGMTLSHGSVFDFEANADTTSSDKIDVTGGTLTGTGTGGVTVNVNMSGTLSGSTTFTLMEWGAATGVEVGDFNLVMTGVGAGTLSIEGGNTLVLTAAPAGTILTIQ